jgi:hypothetical protein
MANEEKRAIFEPCNLVTITLGDFVYRLTTVLGVVFYGAQNVTDGGVLVTDGGIAVTDDGGYFSSTDTDGQQIMALGDVTEGPSGISNRDIELIATTNLVAKLYDQTWLKGTVEIQEGERNPATAAFTAFGSVKTWQIGSFEGLSFVGNPVTLVLKSQLSKLLEPYDALTTSSTSQAGLVSTTDQGLDLIAGPAVTSPTANGGSYPVDTRGAIYETA